MDSIGNANNAVSVVGKWIFDSNDKKMLPLTIESLNLVCACSDEDQYFDISQQVFYAMRYGNKTSKLKLEQKWFDILTNIYKYIYDIMIVVTTGESGIAKDKKNKDT